LFFFVGSEKEAQSVESYVKTKFFRYLVSLRKISQDATRSTYLWVPSLEWSVEWSDQELYRRFQLDAQEVALIESHVRERS
jgi:site-specific DNA-methyltransferase (adenine-specific)